MRHPGPLECTSNKKTTNDDFLLNKFEKVSFRECEQSERWFLRKSPVAVHTANCCYNTEDKNVSSEEKSFDLRSETNTPSNNKLNKSFEGNLSKSINKRFSIEDETAENKLKCGKCNFFLEIVAVNVYLFKLLVKKWKLN